MLRGMRLRRLWAGVNERLLLLSIASGLLFFAGATVYFELASSAAKKAEREAIAEKSSLFRKILNLKDESYKVLINEWTYWDEMVSFVAKPDTQFAESTFREPSNKYGISCVCVFDKSWKPVYESEVNEGESDIPTQELVDILRTKLRPGSPFTNFHLMSHGRLIDIRAAAIHKGNDQARKGPSFGYLVSTRVLSQKALANLGELTHATADVARVGERQHLARAGTYLVSIPIVDNTDKTIANLHLHVEDDKVYAALNSAQKSATIFGLFLLVIWAGFIGLIRRWIVGPVDRIASCLQNGDVAGLENMSREVSEIGNLAESAKAKLEQREELEAMNADLSNLAEQLALKTGLLSDMNMALENKVQERTLELQRAVDSTILGWSIAMDARDEETAGHTQRVAAMAKRLGQAIGLSDRDHRRLYFGSLLHDIGKIGIPDSILLKEGKLTDDEYAIMKKHPEYAFEMLKPIPFLADCLDIPLHHHERWDGNGYPHKLSGTEIPLLARVFAVADVWDALRSDRPYRSAWSEEQTRQHIERSSGTHLDPTVVEAFLSLEPMPHPSDERFKDNRAA